MRGYDVCILLDRMCNSKDGCLGEVHLTRLDSMIFGIVKTGIRKKVKWQLSRNIFFLYEESLSFSRVVWRIDSIREHEWSQFEFCEAI